MKNMKQSRFILFVLSFLVMSVGNVYAQNVTVTGTVLDSTGAKNKSRGRHRTIWCGRG